MILLRSSCRIHVLWITRDIESSCHRWDPGVFGIISRNSILYPPASCWPSWTSTATPTCEPSRLPLYTVEMETFFSCWYAGARIQSLCRLYLLVPQSENKTCPKKEIHESLWVCWQSQVDPRSLVWSPNSESLRPTMIPHHYKPS